MRVVEISMTRHHGEMSHSGIQVEYMGVGYVASILPSTATIAGGTVVTLTGTGFVAGVTACKFGSGSAFLATVVSSTEARCAAPASREGSVGVEVSMVSKAPPRT